MLSPLSSPGLVVLNREVALPGEARLVGQRQTLEDQGKVECGVGLVGRFFNGPGGRGDRVDPKPRAILFGEREIGCSKVTQDSGRRRPLGSRFQCRYGTGNFSVVKREEAYTMKLSGLTLPQRWMGAAKDPLIPGFGQWSGIVTLGNRQFVPAGKADG
jgi:hypothetical protein